MKILIVGGGIGGLTLAAFLKDSNIEYEIVEKSAAEPAGYLLVMWDNARDILNKLGLAEAFDGGGTRIQQYSIRDGKGKVLRNYSLKDFYVDYGSAVTMIARKDLCHWLTSKVDESKTRRGVSVTGISESGDKVQVTLSTGETRAYDAVVGADGIHSTVRSQIFKKDAEVYENWRTWWVWIDQKFNTAATVTEYIEPGEFVLVFSTGDKALAVLTAPADHSVWDTPEGRIERMKKVFKDESALIPAILSNTKDTDAIPSDIVEIKLKRWVRGRVALIGDAAHSFGPHAGLGGSMAMEDAYVLAGELLQTGQNRSIEQAFLNYQSKRRPRVAVAKKLNERMRLWTLIKSKVLRRVVNGVISVIPERYLVGGYNRLLREEI